MDDFDAEERLDIDALLRVSANSIPEPVHPDAPARWTLQESTLLISQAHRYPSQARNWNEISQAVGKPAEICQAWFQTLHALKFLVPERDRERLRIPQKRKRRKADDLDRKFFCSVETCKRGYGSEGALKRHMVNKHPDVPYVPSFLKPYVDKDPEELENLTRPLKPGENNEIIPQEDEAAAALEDFNAALSPVAPVAAAAPPVQRRAKSKRSGSNPTSVVSATTMPLQSSGHALLSIDDLPQHPIALTSPELPPHPIHPLIAHKTTTLPPLSSSSTLDASNLSSRPSRATKKTPQAKRAESSRTAASTPSSLVSSALLGSSFGSPSSGQLQRTDPTSFDIQKLLGPPQPSSVASPSSSSSTTSMFTDPNQIMALLQRPLNTEGLLGATTSTSPFLSPVSPTTTTTPSSVVGLLQFPPPKVLTTPELPASTLSDLPPPKVYTTSTLPPESTQKTTGRPARRPK